MNKRGQFYIITALILSFALFGVTYASNTIEEPVLFSNFNDVSQNYVAESTKLINNLLVEKNSGIQEELNYFTSGFLNYAKIREPSFEMVYFYSEDDAVYYVNELSEGIEFENETLNLGGEDDIVQNINVEVGGVDFVHQVPITASNFGEDWNTGYIDGPFRFSIGGIVYPTFELEDNNFKVVIRSKEGNNTEIFTS